MSNSVRLSVLATHFSAFLLLTAALMGSGTFAAAQAAPQLLPYTVTAVAGGGTYGVTANKYIVGNYCGTNTTTPPAGSPPFGLAAWPVALDAAGDGCLATQVNLYASTSLLPRAAVSDSEGNVFLVDDDNLLIRRVDARTGIITLVGGGAASNPSAGALCSDGVHVATGVWGDGCLATSVKLDNPEAIAVDPHGNVWFTDYSLGAVREINKSTGLINTIVNTASVATSTVVLGYKADNVYQTSGVQAKGILAAQGILNNPYGLTFDQQGNLYIADEYNNVVDVVNLGTASVTVAGNSIPPGEIFTIAGVGCAYTTAPAGCHSTYGKTPSAGSSIAATAATMEYPYQVAVDHAGNIYIADEYNYAVRVINGSTNSVFIGAAGNLSTFVNNGYVAESGTFTRGTALTAHIGNAYGVATDALGNVYITSYLGTAPNYANYILRVDKSAGGPGVIYPIAGQDTSSAPTTGAGQTGASYCSAKTDAIGDGCPGSQATFWRLYFPFVDAAGDVYVADAYNGLIRKLSVGTQFPPTAVGASAPTQTIQIHFGVNDTPALTPYSLPSGFTEFTVAPYTPTGSPSNCILNSDNTTDCTYSVSFTPTKAGLRTAPLVVTSTKGLVSNFALTGTGIGSVLAVDPGTQSTLASTGVTSVSGIAIDNAGNAYASVPGAGSIVAISSTGTQTNVGSGIAGANAVAVDAAGNVYAALSTSVIEVPFNGQAQTTLATGFTNLQGIAVDGFGNLYVADQSAGTLTEILAGTGAQVVLSSSLNQPAGVTVDSYGNVFVASATGNSVTEIPFNGSAAVTLGTGLNAPLGLAVDPAGSLYVADSKNGRIVYIPNENGTLNSSDQFAVPVTNALKNPTGVAIAGNGTLYVSDSYANAVYQIARSSATISFGSVGVGDTSTATANIISMGTAPAVFGNSFFTAGGDNPSSFGMTPATIPNSTEFPAAGYGMLLTPSFTPATEGSLSATFTFGSTSPSAQPMLAVDGSGSNATAIENMSIGTTVPTGQSNWIYGQTVQVAVTMTPKNPSWAQVPQGTVSLTVDGKPYSSSLVSSNTNGNAVTEILTVTGLAGGPHTIGAGAVADAFYAAAKTATPLALTIGPAPLTVTANTFSKAYGAPMPTLTSTFGGLVPGDTIPVSYTTTAVATSPVTAGGYPIAPSVTGSALNDYTVTLVNGTLNVTPEPTGVALATSATSVNSTTQVTLTATASAQTAFPGVLTPTGYVAFYNTVNGVTTQIGANAQVNASGVASLQTTFASGSSTTSYAVTAVYLGDNNYQASAPSAGLTVVSGTPTVTLAPPTVTTVSVPAGQSGLMSFNITPAYGYNGTITFSCTGAPATITCSFSPASIVANGTSTPMLVALTINSQGSSAQSSVQRPAGVAGSGKLPFSLAILPGLLLLAGFAGRSRKMLRKYLPLLVLALGMMGIGLSGCGGKVVAGTPSGAQTITVVATGSGGSFAGVVQQFTVTLNVQ